MLVIDNLTKTYDNGVRALRGVSLDIPPGIFGLLGPNGAGKSTLMRTLATLQDADEGTCRLDDIDVLAEPARLRERLGYLPQDFGVYPRIPAEMLLHHLATLKGIVDRQERREVVDELLVRTALYDVRKRRLGTYSGGMRRRFGIAQALLGRPRLLIVDEPTAGLDPEERHRFLNLLSDTGRDVVVILSTHIVEDIRQTCGRVAMLCDGAVLREGDPRALVDALDGQVWSRAADGDEPEAPPGATVLSSRLIAGRREQRLHAVERPGDDCRPAPPDLEDVYFLALREARTPAGVAP